VSVFGKINAPKVVSQIERLCRDYERALVDNDVKALSNYFWESPHALRFGVAEELYGSEEIEAFRASRKVNFADRKVLRENIVAVGQDLAIATVEFNVTVAGVIKHGRQTQVWVRFPGVGWRIASAHVSHKVVPGGNQPQGEPAAAFGAAGERYVGPPVDPAHRPGVAMNLEVAARIAAPMLAFELPDDVEPAARFTA
jgi:ketosteroid isomerase-like protein